MTHTRDMDRESFVTEALRAADAAIGNEPPDAQALRIFAALKRLRSNKPVIIAARSPVDYLDRLRAQAHTAWKIAHDFTDIGPSFDAIAGIDTPLGRLKAIIWRKPKGDAIAWWTEYYLNDEPITVAEMKRAGLAQRPTTRSRQRTT